LNIHSLKLYLVSDLKKYKLNTMDATHFSFYHGTPSYKIVDIKGLSIKNLVRENKNKNIDNK
jgi:hypothetical protein